MLSKLCFLDVSGHTVHFSRVAVGNLHPAHQHSKAPISPWPVLHFWFWHFFQHGPFDRWEARLLCSADLPFQVAWLAKKGVCVFSWIYSGKKVYALFGQGHHCRRFAAFHVLSRWFKSTYWNLFPAILPCFQILFVDFPQFICGWELSFVTLQVCELHCPWAPFFNLLFWELDAKVQDCFKPYSGSVGQAEPVVNSSSWWENRLTCACLNT